MTHTALALLIVVVCLGAEDGYDPSAHPARVQRRIAAYTAPIRTLDLAAETTGRLLAVALQPGERVPAGDQPVAQLDDQLAALAVVGAEAVLDARRREAESHERDRVHAEREGERAERLFNEGRLAEQARDSVLRERDRARGLVAIDAGLIAAAAAEVRAASARRDRHALRAPAGWVVVERLREPGALVAVGEPILRLVDVSELVAQVRLDETEVAALRAAAVDGSLSVRFAGAEMAVVPARIRRIDLTFDPASRKRLAELVIPGTAAPEASGGLAVELTLTIPDRNGFEIPLTLVAWRLERPLLRTAAGVDLPVVALRRTPSAIIVAAEAIPAGTRLVVHPPAAGP